MKTQQIFAISFRRLPRVDESPGLVLMAIDARNGTGPARVLGVLTDVALRSRLAHFDVHSANEVAAIRKALQGDNGAVTVHEGWPGLGSCLQFWLDFVGSRIRPIKWTCERCAMENREDVGASVGETYSRVCQCGKVKRITTQAYLPRLV
jgi:hypothetical protein